MFNHDEDNKTNSYVQFPTLVNSLFIERPTKSSSKIKPRHLNNN